MLCGEKNIVLLFLCDYFKPFTLQKYEIIHFVNPLGFKKSTSSAPFGNISEPLNGQKIRP